MSSISLAIRKTQIKIIIRYCIPIRMAKRDRETEREEKGKKKKGKKKKPNSTKNWGVSGAIGTFIHC